VGEAEGAVALSLGGDGEAAAWGGDDCGEAEADGGEASASVMASPDEPRLGLLQGSDAAACPQAEASAPIQWP